MAQEKPRDPGKAMAEQLRNEIAQIKSGRPAQTPAEFTEREAAKKAAEAKKKRKPAS